MLQVTRAHYFYYYNKAAVREKSRAATRSYEKAGRVVRWRKRF